MAAAAVDLKIEPPPPVPPKKPRSRAEKHRIINAISYKNRTNARKLAKFMETNSISERDLGDALRSARYANTFQSFVIELKSSVYS